MKAIRLLALIIGAIIVFNTGTYAQSSTEPIKYNKWSVIANGGSMLFYGDLRNFDYYPNSSQNGKDWYKFTKDLSERNTGFGLSVANQFSTKIGAQLFIHTGKLSGYKQYLDAYFKADFWSVGANAYINISNVLSKKMNQKFKLYGLLGVGYVSFKTNQYKISTDELILKQGISAGYDMSQKYTREAIMPVGLGFKYKINKHFDIGIESVLYNVNTDKLDARPKTYSERDKYGYTNINLTYQIGRNEKSLEWVTDKEIEADELTPKLDAINNRIDSLGKGVKAIDEKVKNLQKDVDGLKNPPVEADDDGDGVPNSKDLEPNTPKGNLVNFQGITIRKAGESAGDANINQPLFSIFFDYDRSNIDNEDELKIAEAAKLLKENPNLKIELVGHADKRGTEAYNQNLSVKRAQAVYDKLVKSYGIDGTRLTVTGKGFNAPLSNDVYGVNRRVDFNKKK